MKSLPLLAALASFLLTTSLLHAANGALIQANLAKLNNIVLPDLDFQNLTVQQALNQIDKFANAQPGQQVNFVLQSPANAPAITLTMKAPTLGQALNELAKQAHLQIVPQQYCIALMPEQPRPAPHYP